MAHTADSFHPPPLDTRERLLDAAETLYAEKGLEGVSVRAITAKARANLAAVGYHFGSKDALIQEVIRRRYQWLNRIRHDRLDRLDAEASPGIPRLEDMIDVLLLPVLNPFPDRPRGSPPITASSFPGFSPKARNFRRAFRSRDSGRSRTAWSTSCAVALPHLSDQDIYWRMHFSAGPLVGTLTPWQPPPRHLQRTVRPRRHG